MKPIYFHVTKREEDWGIGGGCLDPDGDNFREVIIHKDRFVGSPEIGMYYYRDLLGKMLPLPPSRVPESIQKIYARH